MTNNESTVTNVSYTYPSWNGNKKTVKTTVTEEYENGKMVKKTTVTEEVVNYPNQPYTPYTPYWQWYGGGMTTSQPGRVSFYEKEITN